MLINLIKKEDFKGALNFLNQHDFQAYFDEILLYAFEEEDVLYYYFMRYMIDNGHDNSDIYYYTSKLMATSLNILPNGYKLAFEHGKKALGLSPNDIALKEYLLLFYEIPEKLLDRKTAVSFAEEILAVKPASQAVQLVMNDQ